jgi:hypothetical protein
MLDEGTAPALPEWTDSFFTMDTEIAAFQSAIYSFQGNLSFAYWDLEPSYLYNASDSVQAQLGAEFDALRQAQQFMGRQWLHASYRSFDIQAEDMAVVTVRETWEDTLYSFEGAPGDGSTQSSVIGHRGPYPLDVTYTLKKQEDGRWMISNVVLNNEPPTWTE